MTKRKTERGQRQSGWSQSARFRAIGSAAIRAWNAQRPHLPKCGAKKRDGESCRNLALANGRCRFHGGRVPKGDQWHRLTYPSGDSPAAEDKFQRKARDHQRRVQRREERFAGMSVDDREGHAHWHRTHKPGPIAKRKRSRAERQAAIEFAETVQHTVPPPQSPELVELDRRLDEARRRAIELEMLATDEGIFG